MENFFHVGPPLAGGTIRQRLLAGFAEGIHHSCVYVLRNFGMRSKRCTEGSADTPKSQVYVLKAPNIPALLATLYAHKKRSPESRSIFCQQIALNTG